MATVYLGIGSNMGDRQRHIRDALNSLRQKKIKISRISSVIETEPVGGPPQARFLNAALKVETELSPDALLFCLKSIEKEFGREPTVKNGPRPIDIDILLYDNICIQTPMLTIPHPRMKKRDFVMRPLEEIIDEDHFQYLCLA